MLLTNDTVLIGVAKRLEKAIPGGIILNQWENPNNALAHELGTGPEIIHAVASTKSTATHPSSEKVDVIVAGAGTGGTISGLSKAIKTTHNPDCYVLGVDPVSDSCRRQSLVINLRGGSWPMVSPDRKSSGWTVEGEARRIHDGGHRAWPPFSSPCGASV